LRRLTLDDSLLLLVDTRRSDSGCEPMLTLAADAVLALCRSCSVAASGALRR
jgi:hypothetical protein